MAVEQQHHRIGEDLVSPHLFSQPVEALRSAVRRDLWAAGAQLTGSAIFLATLRNRIADFETQRELAASTDFPPGE